MIFNTPRFRKCECAGDQITCAVVSVLIVITIIASVVLIMTATPAYVHHRPAWGYECHQNRCEKVELTDKKLKTAVSLPICRMFCGDGTGTLWPKPTGQVKLGQYITHIDLNKIEFKMPPHGKQESLWLANEKRFMRQLEAKAPNTKTLKHGGRLLVVKISVDSDDLSLNYDTDESYKLLITQGSGEVFVDVKASTYYGARHGLETLSQLVAYDNIRNEMQIVAEGEISDMPTYKHRGLLLDTARNYFSVESIKRVIDAMGMVKLNLFHWHITDSQSFPLVLKSHPDLVKYGAYSENKVYTPEQIKDVVDYARARGVRVIPEFDAPAHVGEGWQKKNMTVCYNAQPWQKFCVEPPCGQLDPSVDALYDVLEDIYREMFENFQYPDIFHMGGDEVSVSCWNSSEKLQNYMLSKGWNLEERDFMHLWGDFQAKALARVDKITKKKLPIILWTSRLTEEPFVDDFLNKERYIIQIWTTGNDPKVKALLQRGYRLILSNYDALYFDCGFGGWVAAGNNWCSPYIGWQKVYMNRPKDIGGQYADQIHGGEAAIWSEQIDEHTLDSRFWPRASALAERLWSDPVEGWRDAEPRLLVHRERLVENGIAAESLQPQWCLQHEGECPI